VVIVDGLHIDVGVRRCNSRRDVTPRRCCTVYTTTTHDARRRPPRSLRIQLIASNRLPAMLLCSAANNPLYASAVHTPPPRPTLSRRRSHCVCRAVAVYRLPDAARARSVCLSVCPSVSVACCLPARHRITSRSFAANFIVCKDGEPGVELKRCGPAWSADLIAAGHPRCTCKLHPAAITC